MCAIFKAKGIEFRPGRAVHAIGAGGLRSGIWAGFARSEILHWWLDRGGVLLDIPAEEFAERSESDGSLVWQKVPAGLVIRALLDTQTAHELVKIVTRAATPEEYQRFNHPRLPVLESALHSPAEFLGSPQPAPPPRAAIKPKPAPKPPTAVQELLFDF